MPLDPDAFPPLTAAEVLPPERSPRARRPAALRDARMLGLLERSRDLIRDLMTVAGVDWRSAPSPFKPTLAALDAEIERLGGKP